MENEIINDKMIVNIVIDNFRLYRKNLKGGVVECKPEDVCEGDVVYITEKDGKPWFIHEDSKVPEWHVVHGKCYSNSSGINILGLYYYVAVDESIKKFHRKSWDEYFLNIAKVVSSRSTCLRRRYGAVIVKDFKIVSTGYNGAPRNYSNCCDIGECEREKLNVPKGERYELCKAVHAEQNALIACSAENLEDSTIYIYGINCVDGTIASGKPCLLCERMLVNGKVREAIFIDNTGRLRKKRLYFDEV
jgi:dCMP deaminase